MSNARAVGARGPRRGRAPLRTGAAAEARREVEDTSHDGLMAALDAEDRMTALRAKVTFMARARYGIRAQDAEDIFHEAVATYLVVHGRYPPGDNHFGILVGIFHRKTLEHLGSSRRVGKVAKRLAARLRAERPGVARGEDPSGTAAETVIRDEDAKLIRSAIGSLSPESRDLLLALAEGRATRLETIEALGINPNTFDTRLRSMRLRLRKVLVEAGVL